MCGLVLANCDESLDGKRHSGRGRHILLASIFTHPVLSKSSFKSFPSPVMNQQGKDGQMCNASKALNLRFVSDASLWYLFKKNFLAHFASQKLLFFF